MIKHVILWKLKESLSESEKAEAKINAKRELEALVGNVPGLLSLTLVTEGLASSNADMMLDCALESEDALKGYQVHPLHVAAANGFVCPFAEIRLCMDYEVK